MSFCRSLENLAVEAVKRPLGYSLPVAADFPIESMAERKTFSRLSLSRVREAIEKGGRSLDDV
ncbi:MAG: hypothetical protein WKF77_11405 [Planctomycetaceae bacterium]